MSIHNSQENDIDQLRSKLNQQDKKLTINTQSFSKSKYGEHNSFQISQKLKQSTYLEDASGEKSNEKFHISKNYLIPQKTEPYNKYLNQYNNSQEQNKRTIKQNSKKNQQLYHSQNQQYESISSDKSQQENNVQANPNLGSQTLKKDQPSSYISEMQQKNRQNKDLSFNLLEKYNIRKITKQTSKQETTPNNSFIKSNQSYLQKIQRKRDPQNVVFDLQKYKNSHSDVSKLSSNIETYSVKDLKATQNIYKSSYSQKNKRLGKQSNSIQYPQIQKAISSNQNSKQFGLEQPSSYARSTKNYPVYASQSKKVLSQFDQLERQQEVKGKVHFIGQSNIKQKNDQTKQFKIKQQLEVKRQSNNEKSESKPSLFYVSISGQQMYPSLDLKLKSKQLTSINQQNQSPSKVKSKEQNIPVKTKAVKKNQKQKSLEPQLPQQITILSYRSQFFLKIQTQVFIIKVEFPKSNKQIEMKDFKQKDSRQDQNQPQKYSYQIQRRFSDFLFLFEAIFTNQLGYIIYPFPQKTLQSFVKIKLQSLIGTTMSDGLITAESEKLQLIEKRIENLQNFVNFLLSHEELKYSQELGIFLCQDQQLYLKSKERIEKYIQQYQQLQNPNSLVEQSAKNIKKALSSGLGFISQWWGSSSNQNLKDVSKKMEKSKISKQINSSTISPQDIQFGQYFETLGLYFSKFQLLEKTFFKLIQTQQKFLNFKDIDSQFDYLVKLCTKISSGKQYNRNLTKMIEIELIHSIQFGRKWLEQSNKQLLKRQQLKQLIQKLKDSLTYANDSSSKISKLQRRLERFQKNYRYGFNNLLEQSEKIFNQSKNIFTKYWQKHCNNMKKIWK